ncbi:hypothetical protein FACS1894120_2870 [Clostridia bacterium]|nr:hypothetical protein FACS1894120_2870 [Clostridia bacterium]
MTEFTAVLASQTQAHRAKRFLAGFHVSVNVVKAKTPQGCGYGIRCYENPEHVRRVLESGGIEILEIRYGEKRRY